MTFSDISKKMIHFHFSKYKLFFLCNLFVTVLFFCYASIFTNHDFMDNYFVVDSMISSNIILPSILSALFLVLFLPFSYAVFLSARKREYGVLFCLGMRRKEAVRNLMLDGLIVSGFALIAALAIGTVLSALFYGFIRYGLGIEGLKWRFDIAPYQITVLLYGVTTLATILLQGTCMYFPQIAQLLKTPFQAEKKGKILCYLERVSAWFGKSKKIEFSFLVRHKRNWSIRYVMSIFMLTAVIVLVGLCAGINQSFYCDAERYAPYDVLYTDVFDVNYIKEQEVRELANSNHVKITEYSQLGFARDQTFNYFPVSLINEKFGCEYHVNQGQFLNLFPYDLLDGYSHDLTPVSHITLENDLELESIGSDIRILFNQNPTFADRYLILNDTDFKQLAKESTYWSGKIYLLQLDEWKKSADFLKDLQLRLQENNNVSEQDQQIYYAVSSKLEKFRKAHTSSRFLIFVMSYMIGLFCFTQWVLVHFGILAETDEIKRSIHSLRLLGVTRGEVFSYLRFKNKFRFLPQIAVSFLTAQILIWILLHKLYHLEILGCIAGAGVGAFIFCLTALSIKRYSQKEFDRIT